MRAVIVEIKEKEAVALAEDGTFRPISDEGYRIGQELEITDSMLLAGERLNRSASRKKQPSQKAFRVAAAAALIVVVGSGSFHYASETAFAYTTVTVSTDEAEVELTLNRRDEVIGAEALDENSEKLVQELQVSRLKRKNLETALSELTKDEENSGADISVESRDDSRTEQLTERIRTVLPARGEEQNTEPVQVPEEQHAETVPEDGSRRPEMAPEEVGQPADAAPQEAGQPETGAPECAPQQTAGNMPETSESQMSGSAPEWQGRQNGQNVLPDQKAPQEAGSMQEPSEESPQQYMPENSTQGQSDRTEQGAVPPDGETVQPWNNTGDMPVPQNSSQSGTGIMPQPQGGAPM